jgi:hypothetical protein
MLAIRSGPPTQKNGKERKERNKRVELNRKKV